MSTQASPVEPVDIELLETRVRGLRELATADTRRHGRKQTINLIAGIALMLIAIVCLSRVTGLFFQLDAQALTQIGRLEVEKHLPDSREAAENHLRRIAPDTVRSLLAYTLELLPGARTSLMQEIEKHLQELTAAHERELSTHLVDVVRRTRADLDLQMPQASEEDKLSALIARVRDEFERSMAVALDRLYPQFCRELDRIDRYLRVLGTVEDASLPRRERLHKELIQTFLRLVVTVRQEESES